MDVKRGWMFQPRENSTIAKYIVFDPELGFPKTIFEECLILPYSGASERSLYLPNCIEFNMVARKRNSVKMAI